MSGSVGELATLELRGPPDVAAARLRARALAEQLGLGWFDAVRFATATAAVAQNAITHGGGGRLTLQIAEEPAAPSLQARVEDAGPGIPDVAALLEGRTVPTAAGLLGARRLVDDLSITSRPGSTVVLLRSALPPGARAAPPPPIPLDVADPWPVLRELDRDLLRALEDLRLREQHLHQINDELEDTNRGVVALYAELDERAEYLKRASELKTRFLSTMTHELRTPINSILSLSRLLLDRADGELTVDQDKQVGFIRRSAEALSELVNDLLDLAKIEAGKSTVRATEFTVDEMFAALKGTLRPLTSGYEVALRFDPTTERLFSDEGKVTQILRNLIANAIKFTERGEVRISARSTGDQIVLSVADDGVGIAPADLERIFEEFVQVDGPVQRRVKGTGLGLPLCRRLAELLGGRITVESEVGRGSTFRVHLPLRYRPPTPAGGEVPVIAPGRRPVLIVEDDPQTLYVYESYLRDSGFQIVSATTIEEARRCLAEVRPAAVVLDIILGKDTTWSLLTELKRTPETRDLPVFVLSVIDGRQTAIALGADDFASKPIEREWLLAKLEALPAPSPTDRLLIVDDDPSSRYLLRSLLAHSRYEILEAATGEEGLRMARERQPRAMFLDLMLPDLTGFELLERLRADPDSRHTHVIVYSARELSDEERARLAARNATVVPKDGRGLGPLREALARAGVKSERAR